MRIFVTGGTGFIGSHFINQAHEAGHELVAHRRSPASLPRVRLSKEPSWVDGPLSEISAETLRGCEALVHLAAHSANMPYDALENCLQQNVLDPLRLFRSAISVGIRRFIVAGSCFEYGSAGERYEFIPPDAPLEPTASYPASKAAASIAFQTLAREENLELLILRIFQVYGEGELETRFWPTLRRAALAGEDLPMSEGTQVRDFIHVSDVAAGFVNAVTRDLAEGKPMIENLGSGRPRSLAQFAHEQWQAFHASGKLLLGAVPMRKNEVMRFVPQLDVKAV
jgi:nucleoside-diphosphate-sugar epimerase